MSLKLVFGNIPILRIFRRVSKSNFLRRLDRDSSNSSAVWNKCPIFEDVGKSFHSSPCSFHGEYEMKDPQTEDEVVMLTVINKDGSKEKVRGKVGDNLLYLSKRFEIAMEGACEASLACTTCHVYVDHEFLDSFPEATETEEDLLDGAPFLRDNSRLGCQLILQREHNGLVIKLPAATKNFYVDGHKPTAH